jgi:upstream activation factor subunit UAF30
MKKQLAENSAKSATSAKSQAEAKAAPRKKPNALQQPLKPSADLAALVGSDTLTRGDVVSKIWKYIKAEKLQDPKDGRQILADDKLKTLFKKDKVSMFEMSGILSKHLS